MGIFSVGISGLNAAQVGILTTSHNIANASTAGYNKQEIVQSTNIPMYTGAGFQGQGTNVSTVKRIYDQFLSRQVLSAEAGAKEMESYAAQIAQIDNLLADPNAGLSPAMAAFFKGVQEVAANPSSIPSRQSMLSQTQSLVARFQSLDQRLTEIRDGSNAQIGSHVTNINTFSTQLAEVNQRIIMAKATSAVHAPNDLLDQRDQMLKDLNQIVRVSTVEQSDGSFNVFFGNGQPLVVGIQSYQLQAVGASDDPERTVVAITGVGGTALTLPDSQITGGFLGGLMSFRNSSLDPAQNALGAIAMTLAQNFNDQHKLGMDLTGAAGQNYFNMGAPAVFANALPALPAGTISVVYDTANINRLTSSDYKLGFDGANYNLTRIDTGAVTQYAALPQSVDGMTIDAGTWAPVAGDSFKIQPARLGARNISLAFSDARMIAAAAPIRTGSPLTNTGTATISSGTVNALVPPAVLDVNLRNTVTITFNVDNTVVPAVTTYDVTDAVNGALAAAQPYTAGANITYNGWTTQVSGNPATGDIFTVSVNSNGVSDNRNAMLLGAFQTANTMIGSATSAATASYQGAYSQIVSSVGSKANEVNAIGDAQQGLVENATAALQQVSGVNLDEEAANLLRYQQAYQASAKILATASKVFDEILALGR
jgi:flagellar hook-associated protein 1 FlgK